MASLEESNKIDSLGKRGDIVAEYKSIVVPFIVLQIIGWGFCFAEVARAIGPTGNAIVQALTPIDINFCQLLFFGTLHYGLLDDGRLCWVCRIAFVVDGCAMLISGALVFRPSDTQQAIDALDPSYVPNMTQGWIGGAIWFFMYAVFSAWIGVQTLAVSRRRILDGVGEAGLAAFSNKQIKAQLVALAAQAAIGVWMAVQTQTAAAQTAEAQIRAANNDGNLMNVSFMLAQVYSFKILLFDATGARMGDFFRCKGTRASYVAACFVVLYVGIVLFNCAVGLTAPSSTDGLYLLMGELTGTYQLQNTAMVCIWIATANNFGMTLSHFRNVQVAEDKLLARRTSKAKAERGMMRSGGEDVAATAQLEA